MKERDEGGEEGRRNRERKGEKREEGGDQDEDNFQTLKMILGQNAAGQGLKWGVGSEREGKVGV